ncbi:MAG: NAD(P)-dependent oxidoreductase [Thermomicrobiales bacterium]
MSTIKVVVWDNIGNTILGMRSWDEWSAHIQERLLTEDPDAKKHVVSLNELFPDQELDVVWLYDPVKYQRGFSALFHEHEEWIRPLTDPDTLRQELADADFFILHKEMLPPEALADAGKLRLIQHLGRDYRGVPMEAARARNIPVAATPLVNYSAVAEHVWAMILEYLKRLRDQRDYMQSRSYLNEWGAYHPGVPLLSDLTLGLLGMGEIARPIARVAHAFNMRVIYWDLTRFPDLEREFGMDYVEWDELFRQSDVVSTQLALNEKTEGIIGAREFGLMKPTALFTNSARGKLVDQDALIAALYAGEIGGAALDVYAEEPLPADSPLHALHEDGSHRVILTPHSAAQGPWTWIHDSQDLWFNIRNVLDGKPVKHLVAES